MGLVSVLGPEDYGLSGDSPEGAIAYTRGAILGAYARAEAPYAQAAAAMRAAGVGFRNEQMLNVYQDLQTEVSQADIAEAIGYDQLANPETIGAPPVNWTGQYTYRVNFTTRTLDDDGTYRLETTPKWMISRSVLTPEDAVSAASNLIEMPAGVGTPDAISPGDVIMANLSGAWFRTRPGVLGDLG